MRFHLQKLEPCRAGERSREREREREKCVDKSRRRRREREEEHEESEERGNIREDEGSEETEKPDTYREKQCVFMFLFKPDDLPYAYTKKSLPFLACLFCRHSVNPFAFCICLTDHPNCTAALPSHISMGKMFLSLENLFPTPANSMGYHFILFFILKK